MVKRKNIGAMTPEELVAHYSALVADQELRGVDASKAKKKLETAKSAVAAAAAASKTNSKKSPQAPLKGGAEKGGSKLNLKPPKNLDEAWKRFWSLQLKRRDLKTPAEKEAMEPEVEKAFIVLGAMDGGSDRIRDELEKALLEKVVPPGLLSWFAKFLNEPGKPWRGIFTATLGKFRAKIVSYGDEYALAVYQRQAEQRERERALFAEALKKLDGVK